MSRKSFVPLLMLVLGSVGAIVPVARADEAPLAPPPTLQSMKIIIHIVTVDARTLSEIALFHYGKTKALKEIAEWNNLSSPYRLRLGQKLVLKRKPISEEKGNSILLAMWRKKFGLSTETAQVRRTEPKGEQSTQFASIEPDPNRDEPPALVERKIAEYIPESPEKLYENGRVYFEQRKYRSALPLLNKSREMNSAFVPAWILEIKSLQKLGKKGEAQGLSDQFVSARPEMKELAQRLLLSGPSSPR